MADRAAACCLASVERHVLNRMRDAASVYWPKRSTEELGSVVVTRPIDSAKERKTCTILLWALVRAAAAERQP